MNTPKNPELPNVFLLDRSMPRLTEPQLSEVLPEPVSPAPPTEAATPAIQLVHVEDLSFGTFQPREFTNSHELEGLAASIRAQGVLQPILARRIAPGDPREESFEVVAGERRLRAAKMAGLLHVPIIVQGWSDQQALQVAIIENAQRFDLNPIEEAQAFQRLSEEFGMSQKEISETVGKSRPTISNAVRLLQLPIEVLELVRTGELSAGHGRALLMLEDPKVQLRFAQRALSQGLSVHGLEKAVQRFREGVESESEEPESDPDQARLMRQSEKIANSLGLERVDLKLDSQGRRRLNVVFETEASWKRFYARIRD